MNKFLKVFLAVFLLNSSYSCNKVVSPVGGDNLIKAASQATVIPFAEKEALSERQFRIVQKYAPVIFQETRNTARPEAWDFVTSFDFDGDLIGNNNEENLRSEKFPLPATVYYSFIETETHYFITYSFFHALDWSTASPLVPYTWHENDMENIQVVVQKSLTGLKERPILLSAQAHLNTEVSVAMNTGIKSGRKKLENKVIRTFAGNLQANGSHTAVYLEPGGHGSYSISTKADRFVSLDPPQLKEGFTFLPSEPNIPDLYEKGKSRYQYQLVSTYNTFWSFYRNNINIGDGKLIDGFFDYKDDMFNYRNLPRHFDSDRISAPGKKDSGILPFAFSFSLSSSDLGVIFFNPAQKYRKSLSISSQWSDKYVYNPYLPDRSPLFAANE